MPVLFELDTRSFRLIPQCLLKSGAGGSFGSETGLASVNISLVCKEGASRVPFVDTVTLVCLKEALTDRPRARRNHVCVC